MTSRRARRAIRFRCTDGTPPHGLLGPSRGALGRANADARPVPGREYSDPEANTPSEEVAGHVSTTIMITGPAGAGKSQAAAAWAARGVTPRACIDTDVLRLHVRAGFAAPEHGWNDETQRQWDVAMELWPAMVRVYQRHDVDCVIDIYAPPSPMLPGMTSSPSWVLASLFR